MTVPLIQNNSIGLDAQIEDLLEKSMITMTPRQVSAWMEHLYDPEKMYVMIRDGRVVSCLQVATHILHLSEDIRFQVTVPVIFCTHPDYRLKKCFGHLLDAAINRSQVNDMAMIAISDQVKILGRRSFQSVAKCREFFIDCDALEPFRDGSVYPWQDGEDLYSLYRAFIANFPVRIELDEDGFYRHLRYAKSCGRKIWVAHDSRNVPTAFGIAAKGKDLIRFETVIYSDGSSLAALLKRQARFSDTVCVRTGPNEALRRLFPQASCRSYSDVLVRLGRYRLVSKWTGHDIRDGADLFETYPESVWMQLI